MMRDHPAGMEDRAMAGVEPVSYRRGLVERVGEAAALTGCVASHVLKTPNAIHVANE